MLEWIVREEEAGRKLIRFLEKLFPHASRGVFFRAQRERKLKVNGKRPADLAYLLQTGDILRIYFTDAQLAQFGFKPQVKRSAVEKEVPSVPVLYEDAQLLIVNKPVGMLSQKSHPGDLSLTEICQTMLSKHGCQESAAFKPAVCNRLDRNTAGAVIIAKTLQASQAVAQMLREHTLGKYYWAIVTGVPTAWHDWTMLTHNWHKDKEANIARLTSATDRDSESSLIKSRVRLLKPLAHHLSLVEIQLLTGKSHQIRAQLSFEGFPIEGDGKYNARSHRFRPLLVAKRLEFQNCPSPLAYLNGKVVEAALPDAMQSLLDNKHVEK